MLIVSTCEWQQAALQLALQTCCQPVLEITVAKLLKSCLMQICHLDIKSPNILLNKACSAKISDVGLGRVVKQEGDQSTSKPRCFLALSSHTGMLLTVPENSDPHSKGRRMLHIIIYPPFLASPQTPKVPWMKVKLNSSPTTNLLLPQSTPGSWNRALNQQSSEAFLVKSSSARLCFMQVMVSLSPGAPQNRSLGILAPRQQTYLH